MMKSNPTAAASGTAGVIFDSTVTQERVSALADRLTAYNQSHATLWERNHDGQYASSLLHLFLLDAQEQVIGGLIGRTHNVRAWFEINLLWVDETHRGLGFGRELMERAETEARQRGCLYARLVTSNYHAPGFL